MVSDTIAFSAVLEPRLMRAMMIPKTKDTVTAFKGIGRFGET